MKTILILLHLAALALTAIAMIDGRPSLAFLAVVALLLAGVAGCLADSYLKTGDRS